MSGSGIEAGTIIAVEAVPRTGIHVVDAFRMRPANAFDHVPPEPSLQSLDALRERGRCSMPAAAANYDAFWFDSLRRRFIPARASQPAEILGDEILESF